MTRRVTIKAVADEAGVSISTVSNVVSGRHHQMKPETRDRVLAAMAKLHYRPNQIARSLVTRSTATIGLIVGDLTNSLYPPVTIGAEAACRASGYSLLLAGAETLDDERKSVEVMRAKQVDALIVFSVSYHAVDNEYLQHADREGMPVIAVNRYLAEDSPLSAVWFDHRAGARNATRHLIELGHRRIAHIAGPENRMTGVQRRAGFEDAMADAGIPVEPELIRVGDYSFESGHREMSLLWERRPTAVFIGGDAMALGALRALIRLGVRVPDDLSLVAFGNPDSVRYANPGVTTIDLPVSAAGRTAVELALARMRNRSVKEVRTLQPALLIRETTAPPAV
ncbi:MAG: LacI family DNA-binding transcriptional regulator [Thermomicrobiales bacterium]